MQCRWPWKRTYGQGRTKERTKNSRRHAASARATRKESAGGCRALRGASDRGSNPIRKDLGEGTQDNLRREQASWRQTGNHNMGQGRTLERAKDNRRLSPSARTTRKHSSSDRALREASDRGSKPIQNEKGRSTNDNRRSRISGNRPTPDPYGDYNPKGSDNTKKQPKRERENTLNLRSDRGQTSLDPAGVTPSRRL